MGPLRIDGGHCSNGWFLSLRSNMGIGWYGMDTWIEKVQEASKHFVWVWTFCGG